MGELRSDVTSPLLVKPKNTVAQASPPFSIGPLTNYGQGVLQLKAPVPVEVVWNDRASA